MIHENPSDARILFYLSVVGAGVPTNIAHYLDYNVDWIARRCRYLADTGDIRPIGPHQSEYCLTDQGAEYLSSDEAQGHIDEATRASVTSVVDYRVERNHSAPS